MADKILFANSYPFILGFQHLTEAWSFRQTDKKTFSGDLLFDREHPDFQKLRGDVATIARAAKPGIDLRTIQLPWKQGDVVADKIAMSCRAKGKEPNGEFMRGKLLMTPKSYSQPRLVVLNGKQLIGLDTPELVKLHITKFYRGVNVIAAMTLDWHDGNGSTILPGVHVYLNRILSLNTGDRLGGPAGSSDEEAFSGYLGQFSTTDPITEDEIPY